MSKIVVREAAGEALLHYATEVGKVDLEGNLQDPETDTADMIADLLHKMDEVLGERMGLAILHRAEAYYRDEVVEEDAQ